MRDFSLNRDERWPTPLIFLHWLSVLLILAAFAFVLGRELLESRTLRSLLLDWHKNAGVLLLLLTLLRLPLAIALRYRAPRHDLPPLERLAALAVRLALYGALLAVPLLGWARTNAAGHGVALYGFLPLPAIAPNDPDLADQLGEWHETAAWIFLALIIVHALAALRHHVFVRDGVLTAMLPFPAQKRSQGDLP